MSFSQKSRVNLRRVNFTYNEKLLLVSLIEKNKSWILDNPYSIDGISNWRKKSEVWEEISKNFNILTESRTKRDVRQLRKCWENLKMRYKRLARELKPTTSISLNGNKIGFIAETDDGSLGVDNSALFQRVGVLVACLNQQRMGAHTLLPRNDSPEIGISSASTEEISKSDTIEESSGSGEVESGKMQPLHHQQALLQTDDDVSIVEVTSVNNSSSDGLPMKSTNFTNRSSLEEAVEMCFDKAQQKNMKELPDKIAKRNISGNSVFRNGFKSQSSAPRMRVSPFARPNHFAQNRPQSVDTEKLLRIRYLRSRVREQELKLRMMQQKMRFERERHEAVMTLLHKQSAHYQNQVDRLQDQFNDDAEFCDDWLINVT